MNYNTQYNRNGGQVQAMPEVIRPEVLPENYVDLADAAMRALKANEKPQPVISTSKLRSLFSLFTDVYNEVRRDGVAELTSAQTRALNAAKVRVYYEIGRDDRYQAGRNLGSVGRLVRQSKLLEYLEGVGKSGERFEAFYHYMEALVAFHRYYFGEKRDRN